MRALLKETGTYEAINGEPLDWLRGMLELFLFKPLFGLGIQRQGYDLFILVPSTVSMVGSVPALHRSVQFLSWG